MPSDSMVDREEIMPDPQLEKRQRRRFSAEQKRRILDEVDACTERGEVAAILRREGLYASQLSNWRRQREEQGLAGLEPKAPGRKPLHDAKDHEIARLEQEKAKLARELELARKLIELQKNLPRGARAPRTCRGRNCRWAIMNGEPGAEAVRFLVALTP
jgi:transposase-like protein